MADSVSEADCSEGPPGTGSKSSEQKKKERIRVLNLPFLILLNMLITSLQDNQRRSRARRQEHLADLEKRVAASHAACREAEMQRGAFRDAQVENARLRDLLRIAGVDEALIQSYVNQGLTQAHSADSLSHRALRPRISTEHERRQSRDGRDGSARTSPYPDVSAMRRLNVQVEHDSTSSHMSPTSLPSNHSPQVAQVLPMTPHMLQSAQLQHLSIFQPNSPHRDDESCWGSFGIQSNAPWREN